MNLNRTVMLALVVSVAAFTVACDDKESSKGAAATPSASAAPAAPSAQKETADKDKGADKDKADKEKTDKEAKERADKEKAENESFSAPFVTAYAVGEPAEGAIQLPEPPIDIVEVAGKPPSIHHVWLPGHWHYDFPLSASTSGREGIWLGQDAGYPAAGPDPERFEVVGRAPGADWFWAPGFWRWDGHNYDWGYGHWLKKREGYEWVHPFYEQINGKWESRGWGWEHKDKEWDKHHEGWDHHGGEVWAHPGYFKDREKYVKEHTPGGKGPREGGQAPRGRARASGRESTRRSSTSTRRAARRARRARRASTRSNCSSKRRKRTRSQGASVFVLWGMRWTRPTVRARLRAEPTPRTAFRRETFMRAHPSLRPNASLRFSSLLVAALAAGVVLAGAQPASAQEIEVEIEVVPPPVKVEVIPPAPSVRTTSGSTATTAGRAPPHYWVPGRYEVILGRAGPGPRARWAPVGRRWHFLPGALVPLEPAAAPFALTGARMRRVYFSTDRLRDGPGDVLPPGAELETSTPAPAHRLRDRRAGLRSARTSGGARLATTPRSTGTRSATRRRSRASWSFRSTGRGARTSTSTRRTSRDREAANHFAIVVASAIPFAIFAARSCSRACVAAPGRRGAPSWLALMAACGTCLVNYGGFFLGHMMAAMLFVAAYRLSPSTGSGGSCSAGFLGELRGPHRVHALAHAGHRLRLPPPRSPPLASLRPVRRWRRPRGDRDVRLQPRRDREVLGLPLLTRPGRLGADEDRVRHSPPRPERSLGARLRSVPWPRVLRADAAPVRPAHRAPLRRGTTAEEPRPLPDDGVRGAHLVLLQVGRRMVHRAASLSPPSSRSSRTKGPGRSRRSVAVA